ncbi:hypothetical protein VE03_08947 [Pseudogymnoascus sp. 23342-1-I1]|nr:hypothetical protein VE03_08947 [Pseudogymnoascus sp. 23342-1-I1]
MDLQVSAGYESNTKCFFGHGDVGIWKLGSKYILKEKPLLNIDGDGHIGADEVTTKFVRENTTIPVLDEMKHWKDDKSHFFLTPRAPGKSLEEAWVDLDTETKKTCAREVVEYILQLRMHTSATLQTVDGGPVSNNLVACRNNLVTEFDDKETWWARVEHAFSNRGEEWREKLKSEYPRHGTPYVLTHGDLNTGNIFVHNGHISAIIDWEHAGYFPDWWEFAQAWTYIEEAEWQHYILQEMKKQINTQFDNQVEAGRFFERFTSLNWEKNPNRDYIIRDRENFCKCKPNVVNFK